ncbi:MAG: flagellar biosynthetic protein FliR [Verrucomicrobia bacterium]|nr:flagellar biosynthetic protein FliR [Verrucomicrobiota bacterium]
MDTFFTWILVFLRASALLLIFPLFSGANVPARLRVATAGFLALLITPGIGNRVDVANLHLVQLILLLFAEITLGLFLGFISRLIFYGVQLAGHFVSTEIGLQTSTIITPADSVPVDVPAAVLNLLAMMLFLSLDIHHILIIAFQRSYDILPIGAGGLSNALFDDMTLRVGKIFLLGLQLAAPLMAVGFLLSIVLMMLGRAVPQMNIFFESFTIRLLAGLIVFGFTVNLLAQQISDYLKKVPQDVLEVGRLLSGG